MNQHLVILCVLQHKHQHIILKKQCTNEKKEVTVDFYPREWTKSKKNAGNRLPRSIGCPYRELLPLSPVKNKSWTNKWSGVENKRKHSNRFVSLHWFEGAPSNTVQNPKTQSPAHSSTIPEGCEKVKCILGQNKDKKKNRLIKKINV